MEPYARQIRSSYSPGLLLALDRSLLALVECLGCWVGYQGHDSGSRFQAGGGCRGVHVVKESVNLPQGDTSTSVADLNR